MLCNMSSGWLTVVLCMAASIAAALWGSAATACADNHLLFDLCGSGLLAAR
jgi:hypothetical protein